MQTAILVSPDPDAYPPVQGQARMLAKNGSSVELLSEPLAWGDMAIKLTRNNVRVHCVPLQNSRIRELGAPRF